MVERKLCQNDVIRNFKDIDDFLKTAQTILQRRKSRAGASLEHHVEHLLSTKNIAFTRQPRRVDGRPDIVIPGENAYLDKQHPRDKICILGVKTTCKDRWRQVTKEGIEVKQKHLLTLQRGVSEKQLMDMEKEFVTLVVPKPLHKTYPPETRSKIISVEDFIKYIKPFTT